jgi:hypothetical protein
VERCIGTEDRRNHGGIIGLTNFINENREAVESDLLATGYTLDDVGASLSWDALKSFLAYARPDSALYRKMNPEMSDWSTITKTNFILADIFDQLSIVNMYLRTIVTHKRGKPPEPYKRPGAKKTNTQHMGKAPLANITEMREWIRQRQVREDGI